MEKFIITVDSTEALQKIFETDEVVAVEKSAGISYTAKQKRAKRRKANIKEKNVRRAVGTAKGNPYRGKAGDFYRLERMWEREGLDAKKRKAESKELLEAERNFKGSVKIEDFCETELSEEETVIMQEKNLSLRECFEQGDYQRLILKLVNEYPERRVLEGLALIEDEA